MSFVAEFEPRPLWAHFDQILKIPRGSKNEQGMREYVIRVAERNGLTHEVDAAGNVVVRKPGTAGREQAPTTVLQGHLDMVNEKNSDVEHDFERDPILPRQDGDYVKATGTTLGSDNGIGLAAMLAVMESTDLAHGPLEFLFTIDEETGLTGATELADHMLTGRLLLNLDSEVEGVLTIGCAGGADTHLHMPVRSEATPAGATALAVSLSGLKGGHSGIDIHLQRGNAIKLLARALYAVSLKRRFRLAELKGGSMHNAIPREASATVVLPKGRPASIKTLRRLVEKELDTIREEFRPADPEMKFEIEEVAAPGRIYDTRTTNKTLDLIGALPHGVISMSYSIPGLVETSTNLAVVSEKDGELLVLMSNRSSVASALTALKQRIRGAGRLAGARIDEQGGYPGWQPDVDSPLLGIVKKLHADLFGAAPEVGAIHAGLECGIIGEKFPGMDMISFGPQIEFPHSPDERVKVDSVGRFFNLLGATLDKLA